MLKKFFKIVFSFFSYGLGGCGLVAIFMVIPTIIVENKIPTEFSDYTITGFRFLMAGTFFLGSCTGVAMEISGPLDEETD